MPHSFWSNTIWYLLILITSVIVFLAALIKSKNRKFTIGFTIATLGLVYHIEWIILFIFNSYTYYPKIVGNPYMDSIMGSFISQISISATSAFLVEFRLSTKWNFIFAIIYFLIEELFQKLGIYRHNWYKSIYTLIGLVIVFWLIKIWYKKLISSSHYFLYYVTLFLSCHATLIHIITNPLRLLNIQYFNIRVTGDISNDRSLVNIIYIFVLVNIFIYLYKRNLNWSYKGFVFTMLFFTLYIFYRNGIIFYKYGWSTILPLYNLLSAYFSVIIFDHLLKEKPILQNKS